MPAPEPAPATPTAPEASQATFPTARSEPGRAVTEPAAPVPPRPTRWPDAGVPPRPTTPPRPTGAPTPTPQSPVTEPAPAPPTAGATAESTAGYDPVAGLAADLRAHGMTLMGAGPRPARRERGLTRLVTSVVCAVLGVGLLVGAVLGSLLREDGGRPRPVDAFPHARTLWRTVPVDTLFPRTLTGPGAGPGGADRTWTRIAVAPDGRCADAFDPLLATALSPVGCERLLRATYTDATSTSVTTVGLLITRSDAAGMRALRNRFAGERLGGRADLLPKPYAATGTPAAAFGDAQRASWRVSVSADLPVIVYAVSGFADGRSIDRPEPADRATARGATTDPAQAGLGHDAKGVAAGVERAFRAAAATARKAP
ncbi:hypothetical protein [Streptomyces sp. NPDC057702]|uniref:hypothetical protein n=1 Tax=unclassified Streptomyces TaxID=2593676 RepID=UPI0036B8B46B